MEPIRTKIIKVAAIELLYMLEKEYLSYVVANLTKKYLKIS